MSENVSGWTFTDVKKGPWNQNANYWGCAKASWFGWDWPGAASISTTLHGKGKAILEFGNCHGRGDVTVYKNDVEISSVGAKKEDIIEFEFSDGDVLKITEHNTAVIQFNNLEIIGCSSGMKIFYVILTLVLRSRTPIEMTNFGYVSTKLLNHGTFKNLIFSG